MATTQINIYADSNLQKQAQAILDDAGIDMATAFNLFLRQVVYKEPLLFDVVSKPQPTIKLQTGVLNPAEYTDEDKERMLKNRMSTAGAMKGEIRMSDDFDAPLDDMKEYMN